ncbi:SpoVR family protein [Syntrophobotulus glycolicus DSM 8271]|uniref:SpoVR family protein n=1 Tax=Syntrophobotulus glycolicus (strain DSM 8271 / FlGlyR) TaxID=645991 RepID=F0SU63_SYNGF|nr:SpoVR family protein [Syntrophobotulus glycolicus]ADY55446.1 SpoVR family protein [Syntrophobotulus glycolicus DSM 8271]
MQYTLAEIESWNERIEEIARSLGLDYYPQEFELVNYEDMLSYEAYIGMPSRYPHWSFGKSYEKLKTLYQYNLSGLPYEMVINSDPCIAYLMKDNTLLLQILTMAHVYGHNDFFKNNRLFQAETRPELTLEMFKSHARMIKSLINDPSIGYEKAEKILDAAHALKLQTSRAVGVKRLSPEEQKTALLEEYHRKMSGQSILEPYREEEPPDLSKIPLQPEEDLLLFIRQYGELEEWETNILEIVRSETRYFIPQIETKIINEGWASYWHYEILKALDLPSELHLEFIKRHNDVIAPASGRLNPYYLGFTLFQELCKAHGREKIFEVRAYERDESFLRRYLTRELCAKLHLFEYTAEGNDYFVENVPDEEGWQSVRDTLCQSAGMGGVPLIRVADLSGKDGTLTLEHVFDGRELERTYAERTLNYVAGLWKRKVVLITRFNQTEQYLVV